MHTSYSGRVKNLAAPVLLVAWLCMLCMQTGGVHLHLDGGGESAGLHGTHSHEASSHGHDHSADRDVPVLEELGMTWSKLLPLILFCVALLIAENWVQQRSWPVPVQSAIPRRRTRWRPPLRAPPIAP